MARAESGIAKQTGLCFPPFPHVDNGERKAVKRGRLYFWVEKSTFACRR